MDIRTADEKLQEALRDRLTAGNEEAQRILVRMLEYVPDRGFPETVWPQAPGPTITGKMTVAEAMDVCAEYRKQNQLDAPDLPFYSETYLYELLGKEDARTVLSLLGSLARALGFLDLHDARNRT